LKPDQSDVYVKLPLPYFFEYQRMKERMEKDLLRNLVDGDS